MGLIIIETLSGEYVFNSPATYKVLLDIAGGEFERSPLINQQSLRDFTEGYSFRSKSTL